MRHHHRGFERQFGRAWRDAGPRFERGAMYAAEHIDSVLDVVHEAIEGVLGAVDEIEKNGTDARTAFRNAFQHGARTWPAPDAWDDRR